MDMSILRTELNDTAYAGLSDAQAAAALNAPTRSRRKAAAFHTERGIVAALGPVMGESVLSKVEFAAQSNTLLARVVRWLRDYSESGGLDLAATATRMQLDALQAAGVLTAEEVAALKALGEEPCSRADELGLGIVGDGHVRSAREAN